MTAIIPANEVIESLTFDMSCGMNGCDNDATVRFTMHTHPCGCTQHELYCDHCAKHARTVLARDVSPGAWRCGVCDEVTGIAAGGAANVIDRIEPIR